ncbi:hypothetical protein Anapl_12228 [Anas platyrhynchos]|uniref:Uncharacterized protein n=1 Tax=Anas platyrhynchos TaxID=8839 RepID=R0JEH2_ANAPL|nr:hypothetical protein Anapl_12228 [Anas platyrhynchos]
MYGQASSTPATPYTPKCSTCIPQAQQQPLGAPRGLSEDPGAQKGLVPMHSGHAKQEEQAGFQAGVEFLLAGAASASPKLPARLLPPSTGTALRIIPRARHYSTHQLADSRQGASA